MVSIPLGIQERQAFGVPATNSNGGIGLVWLHLFNAHSFFVRLHLDQALLSNPLQDE